MSKQKQPEQLHVIADDGLITEFKKLADENYEKYSNLLKRLMKKWINEQKKAKNEQ